MFHSIRDLRRALVLAAGTGSLAAAGVAAVVVQPASAATGGSGASLPYAEVQAESAVRHGRTGTRL